MSAALQQELALRAEANGAVGAIHFFFDDNVLPLKGRQGNIGEVFIAGLEA
jgi:hypothetical protein